MPGEWLFNLWTRTAPLRADVAWEQVAIGVFVVGLAAHAARIARPKPRDAAEFLVSAAVLNALDWLWLGKLQESAALLPWERTGAVVLCALEVGLALVFWWTIRRADLALKSTHIHRRERKSGDGQG